MHDYTTSPGQLRTHASWLEARDICTFEFTPDADTASEIQQVAYFKPAFSVFCVFASLRVVSDRVCASCARHSSGLLARTVA